MGLNTGSFLFKFSFIPLYCTGFVMSISKNGGERSGDYAETSVVSHMKRSGAVHGGGNPCHGQQLAWDLIWADILWGCYKMPGLALNPLRLAQWACCQFVSGMQKVMLGVTGFVECCRETTMNKTHSSRETAQGTGNC